MGGEYLMAKLTLNPNIDVYIADLTKLFNDSEEICKRSAYEGARIVADKCRAGIEGLPVRSYSKRSGMVSGVTASQKEGLLAGLGIAHFRNDGGFINVKIGMDGYNSTRTNQFPNGQPNALIIRSLESGTSFRSRNPVITRATNSAKGAAEAAIQRQMDEEIKKRIH
jgi:hypothetical protein